ncbi:rhamnulokinase [Natrarchaeobius halalkaliphilus]|nr:FGGY-family carbohydrate kinase [Natrarchaeobius halalkaliphilus]
MSVRVAVDIGSSSGKVYYGTVDEGVEIEEAHRFETNMKTEDGRLVWDIEYLTQEIRAGLEAVVADGESIDSLAIDTTACDFGLLEDGELLANPYCYLDQSLYSKDEELLETVARRDIFSSTGHNGLPSSYYYQYQTHPELFERADTLVALPQLLSYELGAKPTCETSFGVTFRMMDIRTREWATELLSELDLPIDVLPTPVEAGTNVGTVDPSLSESISDDVDILLAPSHDTAAAMAAIPFTPESPGFLCTGSWFIPGLELEEPVINDAAFDVPSSNELSVDGRIRYLRNLPGFSLLEHCRDTWREEGGRHAYDELIEHARDSESFRSIVDTADPLFFEAQSTGNVIEAIRTYCTETEQPIPESEGEVTRCLLESLAIRTAITLEQLMAASETYTDRLHLVGGGVENELFCQMVASATGFRVEAGPVEATAIGNLLSQMNAADEIASYSEGREIIDERIEFAYYEPRRTGEWDRALEHAVAEFGSIDSE